MEFIKCDRDGKPSINSKEVFSYFFPKNQLSYDKPINESLGEMDSFLKSKNRRITSQALSNCHGDWYEWIINIAACNFICNQDVDNLIFSLPNVSSFNVYNLYNSNIKNIISSLKEKAKERDVTFVTSNPDFVVIRKNDLFNKKDFHIDSISVNTLYKLDDAYKKYIERCNIDDIVGFLSVKNSLRPDRRLQISHEGSLTKAIHKRLCREFYKTDEDDKFPTLKYYAATSMASEADLNGLKTIATHSLVDKQNVMESAVDKVFIVSNLSETASLFSTILKL